MGPIIFVVAAVGLAALGGLGWFVVKLINDGPQEKAVQIDTSKVKAWETAIQTHDPEKAAAEAFESSSEAYQTLTALKATVDRNAGLPVTTRHVCNSLDEYKTFDVDGWLADNLDRDEAKAYLEQLDRMASLYSDIRVDLDMACVMVCDESDKQAQAACWRIVDQILDVFSGSLRVSYSYVSQETRKQYQNSVLISRAKLRRLAGCGEDPRDSMDGGMSPKERHDGLVLAGYRCAGCGRSPLSGAVLKVWTDGPQPECLCERCRRI